MAFMQRQIDKGVFYEVDTKSGMFIVPEEVCGPRPSETTLSHYQPEGFYNEDEDNWEVRRVRGWYGRLSAPGYMDCTDWSGDRTKAGLIEQLRNYE